MKTIILLLILTFFLFLVGCGPSEEVKTFIFEKQGVIVEMSKKIEESPNEAGVDEARKVFEAKKESLMAKRDDLQRKNAKDYTDLRLKLGDSKVFDNKLLDNIGTKVIYKSEAESKFDKLKEDFREAVKVF